MGHFKVNEKDIFFILKEQLNYGSLCKLERYRDLDEETLDMLVTEAIKFAKGVVEPLQGRGDCWTWPSSPSGPWIRERKTICNRSRVQRFRVQGFKGSGFTKNPKP